MRIPNFIARISDKLTIIYLDYLQISQSISIASAVMQMAFFDGRISDTPTLLYQNYPNIN